jgi:hypothetical protein
VSGEPGALHGSLISSKIFYFLSIPDYEHLRINKKMMGQLELVEDLPIRFIQKTGASHYATY